MAPPADKGLALAITRESRVQITLVFTLVALAVSGAWWASNITATVNQIAENQTRLTDALEREISDRWTAQDQARYSTESSAELNDLRRRVSELEQRVARHEGKDP